jgi:MFS family permease
MRVRPGVVRRSPAFGRLLAAQAVGPLGDAMATTALILHVQRTTGTASSVGLLLFAQAVPPLAAPIAGAIADRVRPSRLIVAGVLVQAALVAGLAVAGVPALGPLLAVVVVLALVDAPIDAAVGRSIPGVVDDADLPAANAARGAARELGTVVGPPLAGLLVALSGTGLVLAVDAVTYLAIVPLVRRLPVADRSAPPADGRRGSFRRDVRDGIAAVWHTPGVRAVAVGFWIVVLFSASDDLILPFLATDTFGAGPIAVGLLLAAAAVGLLLGLPLVGPVGRRLGTGGAVVAAFVVMAAGNLATAAAPGLAVAWLAQVVRGVPLPVADSHIATLVQRETPPHLLGRALANVYGGVGVAAAAGYLLGGPLTDGTSPRVAFAVVGAGGLVGAAATAALLRRGPARPRVDGPTGGG